MVQNFNDNLVHPLPAGSDPLPAGTNPVPATGGELNADLNTNTLLRAVKKGYGELAGASTTEALHLRKRLLGY